MNSRARIKQLEKQGGVKSEARRFVVAVGGRYFDMTEDMKKPFTHERGIRLTTWTADEYAAAGFPELTKADYDEIERRGLNDCITFDYSKILTPSR